MLKMSGITKTYRTEIVETDALRDFSLDVSEGEFVAITGPSGSGKTTFLTIAGLLEDFDSGEYQLDGVSVHGLSDNQRARLRSEKIGFVFQAFNLIPDLNVEHNIDVPLRYRRLSRRERQSRIAESLERVGLSSRSKHFPAELSGGQQQRVAIARALAGRPRVLFADEPTGNLDTQMARGILKLLGELHSNGVTIIMVTHDPGLAERAEREVHLVDGRVISGGRLQSHGASLHVASVP